MSASLVHKPETPVEVVVLETLVGLTRQEIAELDEESLESLCQGASRAADRR